MLGDTAVGKTSLLMQFCENKFDANFITTIGVDFKWKTFDRVGLDGHKRRLRLQIWDTAGTERFQAITPTYYRGAMGVVVAYDVTDRSTFKNIRYWVEQLKDHGDAAVRRVLVGNKSDLAGARAVSAEEG